MKDFTANRRKLLKILLLLNELKFPTISNKIAFVSLISKHVSVSEKQKSIKNMIDYAELNIF